MKRFLTSAVLERAYRQAALDKAAEKEAREWIEANFGESLPDDQFTSSRHGCLTAQTAHIGDAASRKTK